MRVSYSICEFYWSTTKQKLNAQFLHVTSSDMQGEMWLVHKSWRYGNCSRGLSSQELFFGRDKRQPEICLHLQARTEHHTRTASLSFIKKDKLKVLCNVPVCPLLSSSFLEVLQKCLAVLFSRTVLQFGPWLFHSPLLSLAVQCLIFFSSNKSFKKCYLLM